MENVYLWRDKYDANQFWVGVKNRNGTSYSGWFACFCDSFSDCFGRDAWEAVKDIVPGSEPVQVRLTLHLK
jgi:hypothetical protein